MNLYNNLKNKVYLGLILVLASIPVHASSETWEAKLDLTIPSLEMPSTLALDSRDKQEIMMGFECCWDQKLIEAVHLEHSLKSIESWSKENQKKSQYTLHFDLVDKPGPAEWTTFILFQALDVYSTVEGTKYDCVKEANPLFPDKPSTSSLIWTKVALITPAAQYDLKRGNLSKKSMQSMNNVMFLVLFNNYHVLKKAKTHCSKR